MTPHSAKATNAATACRRLFILVAAGGLLVGCSPEGSRETKTEPAKGTPGSKPVLVELARVRLGMIEENLERSAPLEAEAQVQVRARTQNPAIELLVEEGDLVAEGQVLLRLENDRQKTDYQQSLSQLEAARIEFEREESLYNQNLISESAYRNARFAFDQAQLRTENSKRELDYTEVRSPIKGTITSRTVKVGDTVGTGTPIFEIIDLESTVAVIHVPEHYLPKLKPDMEARLISETLGGKVFPGVVKRLSPIVDARAGTIKLVVGPRELGALRPGMWVDVELVLDTKQDAVLIPKRSIIYDNDQTFAFKVYADTNGVRRAKRERVVALNTDKEHIEPDGGFAVGDQIVVAGQSGLKDDSPIRELEPAAPTETPAVAGSATNAVSSTGQPAIQSGS